MNSLIKVLEIIIPIFVIISLGVYARKRNKISEEACKGLQQFIMTFRFPFVLFNSCLTGDMGLDTLTAMGLCVKESVSVTAYFNEPFRDDHESDRCN